MNALIHVTKNVPDHLYQATRNGEETISPLNTDPIDAAMYVLRRMIETALTGGPKVIVRIRPPVFRRIADMEGIPGVLVERIP